MNTPGISLFQGADTLNVNSTLDRQEEEEALQDQKRRDEELGQILVGAFDDLDDHENTIDSTTNYQSEVEQPPVLPNYPSHQHQKPLHDDPQRTNEIEIHRLKMLLESKNNELQNIHQESNAAHTKLDELQKHLSITKAELERALREKQNTHELLVETKENCSNKDSDIDKLRSEKKQLEEDNTRLVGQLETTMTMLSDVQRKYDMVQASKQKWEDRSADLRVKHIEDRHRAQCDLYQQQLCQMKDTLDRKQNELDQLNSRYHALQSGHETMLLDKAAKINELSQALDDAQVRCNQLSARPDLQAENHRQQQCISDLKARIAYLEKTVASLHERLNETTAELDLMDSLIQQHQADESPTGRLSQVGGSRLVGSTPLNPLDRVSHIKQELYRALANLKNKREEVRRLEKLLEERNQELRVLRDQENQSLVQLETLKEGKMRLENKVKSMQQELEEQQHKSQQDLGLHSQLQSIEAERDALKENRQQIEEQLRNVEKDLEQLKQHHESLQKSYDQLSLDNRQLRTRATADNLRLELERHKILLRDSQSEVERLKKLYSDIATDKESLDYELRKLRESDTLKELQDQRQNLATVQRNLQLAEMKSEELKKLLEMEKLSHERDLQTLRQMSEREKRKGDLAVGKESFENCSKCLESKAEITKLEIQLLKLQNVNSMHTKELEELEHELEQSKSLQAAMQEKIELSGKQDELINDLKEKAQQFEAYIRQQEEHKQPNKTLSPKSNLESTAEPSPKELTQNRIRLIEQRVRDEMAKLFAAELKKFTTRLQQSEERSQCLQWEYQAVCGELQQRQTEVDLLKQTILAERENIDEILAGKEEKQKEMLQKCRQELQAKNQRIAELLREVEEQHASIDSERQSMKAVMAQWEKQRQSVDQVEQHWRKQLETLRTTHEEAMRSAQQRYQSAKRTAHNYKLYAEDKEAHMKREYERIKHEYELSLAKIEATMNQHLERRSREKHRDKENVPSNSSNDPVGSLNRKPKGTGHS
ncbi:golgin subfamily A member 6-like protein 22 [Drosophila santomea]|uniref:golgin subfamily A member 6-like protein 22 n=1 Tax=Drosophila santomea TaxID=129105 RepID=UPI001952B5DE|nr:golgin subfamily A member 6-like protein 22 [Drosophila santomea]